MIITKEKFNSLPVDENGTKLCPTGDYSTIVIDCFENCNFGLFCIFGADAKFGKGCNFDGSCTFGEECTFGENCEFGKRCSFGECCSFEIGCLFASRCTFGEHCNFGGSCKFGEACGFEENCNFGTLCSFGKGCHFEENCSFDWEATHPIKTNGMVLQKTFPGINVQFFVKCPASADKGCVYGHIPCDECRQKWLDDEYVDHKADEDE